jgi:protein arginine kinase
MTQNLDLPPSLLEHTPWENDKNPIWLATSLILLRNLSRSKFPPKLKEREAGQTLNPIQTLLCKSAELKNPTFFPAETLSSLDKEFLFEHFLCFESFQNTVNGQGFIVDESGQFLAFLNLKNHLQLQLIDSNASLEGSWTRLSKIETEIAKTLDFAFSPKFGYLTADPTQCGTGLIAISYLHLPALIHTKQLHDTLAKQKDEDLTAMGLEGSLDELVGDILVLRNHYTLGLSEENIIHDLQSTSMKLMAAEKAIRAHLRSENNALVKDAVSRAFGLLIHSYQLQTKEALNALSLVKLGVDLGWITGILSSKLNDIFFKCRRAHLAHHLKEKSVDTQDVARKRAEFIHAQLQGVQFKE